MPNEIKVFAHSGKWQQNGTNESPQQKRDPELWWCHEQENAGKLLQIFAVTKSLPELKEDLPVSGSQLKLYEYKRNFGLATPVFLPLAIPASFGGTFWVKINLHQNYGTSHRISPTPYKAVVCHYDD